MRYYRSLAFLVLLAITSVYSYWLSNRDYEWIVPYISDRAPAAVRDSTDFQKVIEKPMRVFKREDLVGSISIENKNGKKYLHMGQFAVDSAKGKNLICIEYPQMKLKFAAEGISINGVKPTVWVTAPCTMKLSQSEYISEIALPFSDMSRWPAQDQKVEFNQPNMNIELTFENVRREWPSLWQLEAIEFWKSDDSSDKIILNQFEFLKKLGEPIMVKSN